MLGEEEQRHLRYFGEDFLQFLGRKAGDLFRFVIAFLTSGIKMLFPRRN